MFLWANKKQETVDMTRICFKETNDNKAKAKNSGALSSGMN